MNIPENNNSRQIALLSSAFIFAYILGVVLHEIGHVIAYSFYDIPTQVFVIHPFGRNYMLPAREVETQHLAVVYAAGSIFNMGLAGLALILLDRTRNLYLLPVLMLSATSFIQESIGMILDLLSGSSFDWYIVAESGIPKPLVYLLSISCLAFGSYQFTRILSLTGLSQKLTSTIKAALLIVAPYFVVGLLYVSIFEPYKIMARSIALTSSIVLATAIALFYCSRFYQPEIRFEKIGMKPLVFALLSMIGIVLLTLLTFNQSSA